VEHGTIVIERRYPASPERTFAAWADAAAKARWLDVRGLNEDPTAKMPRNVVEEPSVWDEKTPR
jgi:uncharacterized protein YndB with AHSA1/START domain